MTYFVKRDLDDKPVALLRIGPRGMEQLTRYSEGGWQPTSSLDWTGIGGSSDWDAITETEALEVAAEMRGNEDSA